MAEVKRTCSIDGCEKPVHSRGWCGMHVQRWKRNGNPLSPGTRIVGDDVARFWSKVDKTAQGGCWMWTGSTSPDGYGVLRVNRATVYMPRYSWELANGPMPLGTEPDHLCRNRWCVNPDHLEPVSHRENILRGESPQAVNARKTHCPQGHEYTPENTKVQTRGGRLCRICQREHSRNRRRSRRFAMMTTELGVPSPS